MLGRPVNILVVEDDTVDAESIQRAFLKMRIANPMFFARDGEEALAMLKGEGQPRIARPYLVLLDLNMPRMNGHQFLEIVRGDPELRDSVVFVLTTSDDERDILASYEKNVAGYLVKDRVGEDFVSLVAMLDSYWTYVELPPERRHAA